MKSILLYANDDGGMAGRLDAAICLSAQFECLVTCVQVTPYDAFISADPFGGMYVLPSVVDEVGEAETAHRERVEDALKRQRVRYEWQSFEGHPGHVLADQSRLADLAIVSLPKKHDQAPMSLAPGLALHARVPVLALPPDAGSFTCRGDALVAWNGSREAAYALRCAIPLLKAASGVDLVTVARNKEPVPTAEAAHYLLQHGIEAVCHDPIETGSSIADALIDAAGRHGSHFMVAGADGRSRLRNAILGGVTGDLVADSPVPLFLAH